MNFKHLIQRPLTSSIIILAAVAGCTGTGSDEPAEGPDYSNLVPAKGVITLNGEPLSGAVVTFLPEQWAPGVGETDEKGEYDLSTSDRPGIPPGDYKVAISLLLSAEGEPQGIGPRSSLAQPPGMLSAKEYLPREYADLGSSKLTAHVDKAGGTFDFDVKAPGVTLPPRPGTAPKPSPEGGVSDAEAKAKPDAQAEGDPAAKKPDATTSPAPPDAAEKEAAKP